MKFSAILRVVMWSLVTIFLTVILISGIRGEFMQLNLVNTFGYTYSNGSLYIAGGGSVSANDIKEIDIDWISGNINIVKYSGNEILFSEEDEAFLEEDQKMHYYINNGKLNIKYKKSDLFFNFKGLNKKKNLEIKIPESLDLDKFSASSTSAPISVDYIKSVNTDIDTISGKITLYNIETGDLKISAISGSVNINSIDSEKMLIDTVSGAIDVGGNINKIDFDTISGEVVMNILSQVKDISVDSISGSVKINIPEDINGFILDFDSVSGRVTNEFSTSENDKKWVYGDGNCGIDVDTVSGTLKINKGGSAA